MSIIVTAGHGGSDPGASGNGFVEAKEAIILRDLISTELVAMGVKPKNDANTWSLIDVIKNIITTPKDICLDIHWNSGPVAAGGTECYISDNHTQEEVSAAKDLVFAVNAVCGFKLRSGKIAPGVKTEAESARKRLGILRQEEGINLLLEVCFISNPDEMSTYVSRKKTLAMAIAKVLFKYYKK